MIDREQPSNKNFGNTTADAKSRHSGFPIKKCHCLEGKYFIVIDKSIVEKLNFSNSENAELYFEQEVTQDSNIILHRYEMRD